MKSARLTDSEIRERGWKALVQGLGASGAVRFAMQTERGAGDYPQLRHRLLGGKSVSQDLAPGALLYGDITAPRVVRRGGMDENVIAGRPNCLVVLGAGAARSTRAERPRDVLT